jgi:hypothetical protein
VCDIILTPLPPPRKETSITERSDDGFTVDRTSLIRNFFTGPSQRSL